ncbi:hypothetical protein BDP27DRAFT_1360993 [Rhodocollybia butyracea]|uniref:Uncharacterized protein n=1 Tax=Rhodocollybia butyracea TaxID=206335 RepID=A0A9P5UAV3_9AGAR|nr:hypothetical protein BDP27DRAFT_1360993 [Rhodocollybia butyracea]
MTRTRKTALGTGGTSNASAVQAQVATDSQGEQEGPPTELQSPPPNGTQPGPSNMRSTSVRPPSPTFSQTSRDEEERIAENALKSPPSRRSDVLPPEPQYPGGYAGTLSSLGGVNPYAGYQPGHHLSSFVDQRNHLLAPAPMYLKPPAILTTDADSGQTGPVHLPQSPSGGESPLPQSLIAATMRRPREDNTPRNVSLRDLISDKDTRVNHHQSPPRLRAPDPRGYSPRTQRSSRSLDARPEEPGIMQYAYTTPAERAERPGILPFYKVDPLQPGGLMDPDLALNQAKHAYTNSPHPVRSREGPSHPQHPPRSSQPPPENHAPYQPPQHWDQRADASSQHPNYQYPYQPYSQHHQHQHPQHQQHMSSHYPEPNLYPPQQDVGQRRPEHSRTDHRKVTKAWTAPSQIAIGSRTAPWQAKHRFNTDVVATLRSGFHHFIPLAYFGNKHMDSTTWDESFMHESLHFEDDGGNIRVKKRDRFTDKPLRDITRDEWSAIIINMPRLLREELIVDGDHYPRAPIALDIANMFEMLFTSMVERPDYFQAFEAYKEYAHRAYKQWHTYPDDPIHIGYFHEGAFAQILNERNNRATAALNHAASQHSNQSNSQQSYQSNSQSSSSSKSTRRGEKTDSFRTRSAPPTQGSRRKSDSSSEENMVCYLCGGRHGWREHDEKASDGQKSTTQLIRKGNSWFDSTGRIPCISYNGTGCRHNKCNFKHACGRCGSTDHNSQNHNR